MWCRSNIRSYFLPQIFESPEFEKFIARREIKMQKTTEGLGIMIIELGIMIIGHGIMILGLVLW